MRRLVTLAPVQFQIDSKGNVRAVLASAMSGILPPPFKFVHTCAGEFRAEYSRSCRVYHTEYLRLIADVLAALSAEAVAEADGDYDDAEQARASVETAAAALHEWLAMRVAGKGVNTSTTAATTTRSGDEQRRLEAVEAAVRGLAGLKGRVESVESTQSTIQASIRKLTKMWQHLSYAFSLVTTRRRLIVSDDEGDEGEQQEQEQELEEGEVPPQSSSRPAIKLEEGVVAW
jgi:hypothetical protein